MLRIFEEEVEQKRGRSTTVGTREYLLEKAKVEGLEEGRKEEAMAIAREMKKEGISVEQIVKFTKLPATLIENWGNDRFSIKTPNLVVAIPSRITPDQSRNDLFPKRNHFATERTRRA